MAHGEFQGSAPWIRQPFPQFYGPRIRVLSFTTPHCLLAMALCVPGCHRVPKNGPANAPKYLVNLLWFRLLIWIWEIGSSQRVAHPLGPGPPLRRSVACACSPFSHCEVINNNLRQHWPAYGHPVMVQMGLAKGLSRETMREPRLVPFSCTMSSGCVLHRLP